ncbi:MAG TPA: copper chaperone PCu(A)C [Euzebyales bacterium]|nr:copper chaperone PCu(A)C [Euzebyales bacterium]
MKLQRTTATRLIGTIVLLLAACSGAASGGEISVTDAHVPVPAGANGAAYMTLTNDGDADDTLVRVSTDVAETVGLHETSTQDGSMSMQEVDGIDIPAGGDAVLEPGGLHVMLIGVTQDLAEGDTLDLTLTFDNAGEQTVSAEVVPLGDMPGMDMDSEG